MNLKLVAIVLVSMLLVHESESWFIRIRWRRIGRAIARVWKPVCHWGCPRGCNYLTGGFGCKFGCRHLCGRRKRLAIDENVHVTLLPKNIGFYDLNDDNFIELWEIARTLGHQQNETDLGLAYNSTDTNQDGILSAEEFLSSTVFFFADSDSPTL